MGRFGCVHPGELCSCELRNALRMERAPCKQCGSALSPADDMREIHLQCGMMLEMGSRVCGALSRVQAILT